MPSKSYDACARQFAAQWNTRESHMHANLASGSRELALLAIQKGAGHFRVARNFPTRFDVGRQVPRLAPALDAIEAFRASVLTIERLPQAVKLLRAQLGDAYGGGDRLSAATKFLWLLHRSPVVIFDSQARLALNAPNGDYEEYLRLWFGAYDTHEAGIAAACEMLAQRRATTAEQALDIRTEWFRQRVHDIYLWNVGTP